MVQVKKKAVRDAIVDAAAALFSDRGFRRTKLADIARDAQVGVGNIYSYFPSKLHLLYEVYRPWLFDRLTELEAAAQACGTPREKIRCILLGVWREIPAQNTGLANSLMEALANAEPGQGKVNDMLLVTERWLNRCLRDALPADRRFLADDERLSHLVWMAYDGFVINRRLGDVRDLDAIVEISCDLLLGEVDAGSRRPEVPLSATG